MQSDRPDPALLSARLKGLRARTALHQAKVAEELGVPTRTFQSWENGEAMTSHRNYSLIATFYSERLGEKISVESLLYGSSSWADVELQRLATVLRDEMDKKLAERQAKENPPAHEEPRG